MLEYLKQNLGKEVQHPEFGQGILLTFDESFASIYFREHGQKQVPLKTLSAISTDEEIIVNSIKIPTNEDIKKLYLAIEAMQLPLLDSAASLTSAKIDLLPHQIVLTYKISKNSPRRYLIADEVGLGKTVEAALILRELASRGELNRALIVVPAGLVENWRRELNETFNLDFEVFGAEGDVTDRRSNAFAKHNRIIASVDTLKRPTRIKKILDAPRWDLIVFDEAHHLTAYKKGGGVNKTQNFKLAEALKEHSRDMILLSATPHQGDNFRFWMLVRLLQPKLFHSVEDMISNRHRLNSVVIRRTKADTCKPDGSLLFARRQVHTKPFALSDKERIFYDAIIEYIAEGYNLAAKKGQEGRGLGFIMTIFQKIASSSFAAIKSTLVRRMLMLTIREIIEFDNNYDADGRNKATSEAIIQIREIFNLENNPVGNTQAERILADYKMQILKKLGEKDSLASIDIDDEAIYSQDEQSVAMNIRSALPQERNMIEYLLAKYPDGDETKTKEITYALNEIWKENPDEKVIIFTTYLGSVDVLKNSIQRDYPNIAIEVLKGGDHSAKRTAEKRFKKDKNSKVLICTAAGREGINLQFARILINHDLPWNPMDLEQRIGRIHRYGQKDTAQVYNIVAADTIEGQVYLTLEEKIEEIAKSLGKRNEEGKVTEDLRSQILGQLSEKLSYNKLYQEALNDPELQRTKEEIEVASNNAKLSKEIVFELFQDLDNFRIDDYKKYDDEGKSLSRLIKFINECIILNGGEIKKIEGEIASTRADVTKESEDMRRAADALAKLGEEKKK